MGRPHKGNAGPSPKAFAPSPPNTYRTHVSLLHPGRFIFPSKGEMELVPIDCLRWTTIEQMRQCQPIPFFSRSANLLLPSLSALLRPIFILGFRGSALSWIYPPLRKLSGGMESFQKILSDWACHRPKFLGVHIRPKFSHDNLPGGTQLNVREMGYNAQKKEFHAAMHNSARESEGLVSSKRYTVGIAQS